MFKFIRRLFKIKTFVFYSPEVDIQKIIYARNKKLAKQKMKLFLIYVMYGNFESFNEFNYVMNQLELYEYIESKSKYIVLEGG